MLFPPIFQEISSVLGTARALSFVRYFHSQPNYGGLSVPKRLRPNSCLLNYMDWDDAELFVEAFGGSVLEIPKCSRLLAVVRVQALWRQHFSLPEIAAQLGCSVRSVYRRLKVRLPPELRIGYSLR